MQILNYYLLIFQLAFFEFFKEVTNEFLQEMVHFNKLHIIFSISQTF